MKFEGFCCFPSKTDSTILQFQFSKIIIFAKLLSHYTIMSKLSYLSKTIYLAALLFCGCQNADNSKNAANNDTKISPAEKQQAEKEIAGRIDEIIAGAKKLDFDSALRPYSNTPDFTIVNPDGSVNNFQEMDKGQKAFAATAKSILFTTTKESFKFFSKTLVMCTWEGRNEFELKTGERLKVDPYVGSMLFSKKNGEWKIIYAHETSAIPVPVDIKK